jgi:uncharacterized protein
MRLASIHTYPVKSCHRVDQQAATVQPWGLAGDRRWLVVDPSGDQVTQREAPVMTRIRPEAARHGGITLRAAGAADLEVPPPPAGPLRGVTVWGSTVKATPAGDDADAWLSALLDRPVGLVWLDDPTRRVVDPAYGEPADRVGFADGFPLLLTNQTSLDALNGWLLESGSPEGPLPMTRFRPNVVVAGADAWAEDGWLGQRLRIGQVTFRVAKPCGRCVVTTTDQETGKRGGEPLIALARHRAVNQKLLFGVLLIPDAPLGDISVGDPVTAPLDC